MNTTPISWAEKTWNPISGCTPISEGCANCYAKRMAQRLRGRCGYPADDPFRVTLHPERLQEPLRMRKPARIFVASMGDLFHEDMPDTLIDRVFATMALAPQHTYMVLTKRPERMRDYLAANNVDEPSISGHEALCLRLMRSAEAIDAVAYERLGADAFHWHPEAWPQVWLGVTAENQARADERIPILLQVPAAVRFVSCEPLLGPIDLTQAMYGPKPRGMNCFGFTDGCGYEAYLQWIIAGGETGPGARPMHPDWVRSLRDQCQVGPTPFHFKSWGEWGPASSLDSATWGRAMAHTLVLPTGEYTAVPGPDTPDPCCGLTARDLDGDDHMAAMARVGTKAAGRLLDGREWDEYPEVSANA